MIDVNEEQLLTLEEVTKRLPGRDGKRLHISSVFRWAQKGVAGVRLEVVKVGGRTYTTEESLQRFADQVTAARNGNPIPTATRTSAQRRRASERADLELSAMGV